MNGRKFRPTVIALEPRDCPSYVCSVSQFGANGNGIADSTAAIQAAIDSVPSGGGTVFVPAGLYRTSSTLTITTPGTTLLGAGSGNSGIQLLPAATPVQAGPLLIIGTGQAHASNIIVCGLWLDGNHNSVISTYGTNFGVFIASADTVSVCYDWISNFIFDGVEVGGGHSSNVSIDHDYIQGCGRNGIAVGYADNVAIFNCYIDQSSSQYWGVGGPQNFQWPIDIECQYFDAHISNVLIRDCTLYAPLYANWPVRQALAHTVDVISNYGPVSGVRVINVIANGHLIKSRNLYGSYRFYNS